MPTLLTQTRLASLVPYFISAKTNDVGIQTEVSDERTYMSPRILAQRKLTDLTGINFELSDRTLFVLFFSLILINFKAYHYEHLE